MPEIAVTVLDATPARRHDHRVRAVSADYALLRRLDHLLVHADGAALVVEWVCHATGVPVPQLKFHARRSPFTGATEGPRHLAAELARQRGIEPDEGLHQIPEHGAMRLGRSTTLMTVAHELGHHLVHHHDAPGTPAHGNRWVRRFDEAAAVIDDLIDIRSGLSAFS